MAIQAGDSALCKFPWEPASIPVVVRGFLEMDGGETGAQVANEEGVSFPVPIEWLREWPK